MEWIKLTPGSPFVDKQIAESRIRTHTGASVIQQRIAEVMNVSIAQVAHIDRDLKLVAAENRI